MALSWDELSADHKIVFLLESLANEKEQQAPIACRFCDEIFVDNKSLLEHFQSHLHQAGASNGRPLVGSSVGNSSNFISRSSQYTNSWKNLSPDMPNLSLGNSRVTTLSQNSLQLRGSTLTNRRHPFLSPSTSRGTFASKPNHSSNFSSRFSSQSTGLLSLRPPIRPTSEAAQQSNFSFPPDHGTSVLTLGPTRRRLQTVRENEVEGPSSGYARPYIDQLERPIRETIVVPDDDDVAGNDNRDEVDLTLKLGLV